MPWVQVGIINYIKAFSQISRHELFFKLCFNLIPQNDQDFSYFTLLQLCPWASNEGCG